MTAPLLSMADMRARYGTNGKPASRTYIYHCEETGDLPRSVLVGGKRFWRLTDVVALEDKRFAAVTEVA
ncbi:MAG: hypothetical protein C207_01078 [Bradyrhizobium sp. DFCI-1]|uniref:hypothetical protein n=1 Tax=Klebsiella pneumoniae TaxID=573 RepID=UPI000395F052|nr:MAG: hypothetical protein C207_01078 [Bradyrhizobium sp. DFCI-1]MEE4417452.1 hypothetical protein [Klebsiella pneumoniae]HAR17877.1 hypothetical protein [Bradyrhizobium sp.]